MVGILFTPSAPASPSHAYTLEPCPFCRFSASTEQLLISHVHTAHANVVDQQEEEYVLCCDELVPLSRLQRHMDRHETSGTKRRRRERRNGSGDDSSPSEGRREKKKHRERSDSTTKRHRGREKDVKDPKVSFITPDRAKSTNRSGLNWFERAALAIVFVRPSEHRSESRSRRSESTRRAESVHLSGRSESVRRESVRRSESAHRRKSRRRSPSREGKELALKRSDSKRAEHSDRRHHRRHSESDNRRNDRHNTVSAQRRKSSDDAIKKLGQSDLGPYAEEAQMPSWLRAKLAKGGKVVQVRRVDPTTGRTINSVQIANETPDLIPTIALLLDRDKEVAKTYLCHPKTKHVGKQIPKEGGFCGYRNIQMLVSYIQAAYPRGSHPFEGRIPTILKLQDMIEDGWDHGINSNARLETGGIRGTRRYIGTSEAQTLFTHVGLQSRARAFQGKDTAQAQKELLDFVEQYYRSTNIPADAMNLGSKVVTTSKPPIYFQHAGHSMTIIGIERRTDGTSNLLVFDPYFSPTEAIRSLAGTRRISRKIDPVPLLKSYRRSKRYLGKYKEFEVILLEPPI